jgi:DNA-binding transcriptional regulator/RsmH inhibitor MraZ
MSAPLGRRCVVSVEGEGCIACYSQEDWKARSERVIAEYGELNPAVADYLRLMHAFADDDVSIDDANRLNLPPWIRTAAGLKEQDALVVVGRGTSLEVWKKQIWDQKFASITVDQRSEMMNETLKRMGFKFGQLNPTEVSA